MRTNPRGQRTVSNDGNPTFARASRTSLSRWCAKWCLVSAAAAGAVGVVGLGAGCKNAPPKKTTKEEATLRWNQARAGVLTSLAQDQYAAGHFDKCRESVDDALKLDPDNVALHLLSAKLGIEQGQLELAQRELDAVRKTAPNEPEAYYLSGVIYQRWQQPQTAYEFYKLAGEKAPAELGYLMAEAEMLVALDRSAEALPLLQAKMVYHENSPAIRDAVGQLLMQAGRYHEAVEALRQASILASEELPIRERLGLALYYDKQYADGVAVLEPLVRKEPFDKRADLFLALGECQSQSNRPRDARASFETACQLNPALPGAWLALGRTALEMNDFKRADLALRKSLSLDPDGPDTHLLLGYVRLKQGKLTDALQAFTKATTLDRRDPVALCMVGYVFERLKRPEAAMQCYAKALKIKPGDEMASQLMAGVELND